MKSSFYVFSERNELEMFVVITVRRCLFIHLLYLRNYVMISFKSETEGLVKVSKGQTQPLLYMNLLLKTSLYKKTDINRRPQHKTYMVKQFVVTCSTKRSISVSAIQSNALLTFTCFSFRYLMKYVITMWKQDYDSNVISGPNRLPHS